MVRLFMRNLIGMVVAAFALVPGKVLFADGREMPPPSPEADGWEIELRFGEEELESFDDVCPFQRACPAIADEPGPSCAWLDVLRKTNAADRKAETADEKSFSRAIETLLGDPRTRMVVLEGAAGYCVLERGEAEGDVLVRLVPREWSEPPPACPTPKSQAGSACIGGKCQAPRPLAPAKLPSRTDPELASLQRAYVEAIQSGIAEAASKAANAIARAPKIDPKVRPVGHAALGPEEHHVAFAGPPAPATVFHAHDPVPSWRKVAHQSTSVHFQGATIEEVARFFHHASGMTVRLESPETGQAGGEPVRVYCRCRELPLERCLTAALATCGMGYCVRGSEILVAPVDKIRSMRSCEPCGIEAIGW